MKTFEDLKFISRKEPFSTIDSQALMFFDNGYGISVITGKGAYSDENNPYEAAVLKGNQFEWNICYDTPITDDVIGYNTAKDITSIMKRIQELPIAK